MSIESGTLPFLQLEGEERAMSENVADILILKSRPVNSNLTLEKTVESSEIEGVCSRFANDFWEGLMHMAHTPTGFPTDMLQLENGKEITNQKTSPTNIGLFLASNLAARDMNFISPEETEHTIDTVLNSLEYVEKYKGLFYNWYSTHTGVVEEETDNPLISTVDNAWLAVGLMTITASMPGFSERAEKLIEQMDFPLLYNEDRNLFYGGYYPNSKQPTAWHYDILNTETRIASYVGISTYGIPSVNYTRLGKFAPADVDLPHSITRQQFASWGGSMFEALMPTLFVPEQEWSYTWEENHNKYIQQQIKYGIQNNSGYWGYSPCNSPLGIYQESGLPELAIKEGGYGVSHIITPHAIFLSLPFTPKQSIENLQHLEYTYPTIYKKGIGFSDSVNIQTGDVAHTYLSLDQTMSFIALFNTLSGNKMHNYFSKRLEGAIRPLIEFTNYDLPLVA